MKKLLAASSFLLAAACQSNDEEVRALAVRLANEGGDGLSQEYRQRYIACGEKALSGEPSELVRGALAAPDAPARWAILGSDALDRYIKMCREVDLKRGPPQVQ